MNVKNENPFGVALVFITLFLIGISQLKAQCPTDHFPTLNGTIYIQQIKPVSIYQMTAGGVSYVCASQPQLTPYMDRFLDDPSSGYFQYNWKRKPQGKTTFIPFEGECDRCLQTNQIDIGDEFMIDVWYVNHDEAIGVKNYEFQTYTITSVVKPGPIKPTGLWVDNKQSNFKLRQQPKTF